MSAMIYFLAIKLGISNELRKFFKMHGCATQHRVVKAVLAAAWRLTCKQDKYLGHSVFVLLRCCEG